KFNEPCAEPGGLDGRDVRVGEEDRETRGDQADDHAAADAGGAEWRGAEHRLVDRRATPAAQEYVDAGEYPDDRRVGEVGRDQARVDLGDGMQSSNQVGGQDHGLQLPTHREQPDQLGGHHRLRLGLEYGYYTTRNLADPTESVNGP